MWPSLPVANQVADFANIFFIASLVVGVVSTVTIVWMTGVKETYWEKDRQESVERIAALATQGDQLRKDTAVATERASEAELKLAEFRKPRSPIIQEHAAEFVASIAPFKGTKFDMGHAPVAREQWDFAWQLEPLMAQAGWEFVEWSSGNKFEKLNWTMVPHSYGVANVTNVSVELEEKSGPEFIAATALVAAFKKIGIEAITAKSNNGSPNKFIVHLLIGEKG
jgi:hypothetical protein